MGQIQYSEKYLDDIYEYRYCILTLTFKLFLFLAVLEDYLSVFDSLSSMVNEIDWYRHVVLPPDVAKLLPKNRLLSEVSNLVFVILNWEEIVDS